MLCGCSPVSAKIDTDFTVDDSGIDTADDTAVPSRTDLDSDNYFAEVDDCDDVNVDVNPGATEVCDEVDNDCDLQIDDADDSACS
ncbi:MAG: MopE-related protein [Candidatus Uhrbacteria bacterium]|nr:MopE-related protein [Candidatus Uhrbacteria bacterium]